MKEFIYVLYGFCVLCFVGINGQVCNDLDSDVCTRLSQLRPDMCVNSCFSSICTRFCGQCPLKCYKCHEIDHPANCTTLVDCPSGDHHCFTTQTFTDNFDVRYNMGCAMKNLCEQNVNAGKRSDLSAKGSCCTMDNCNNKLPSEIDLLPHRTTVVFQNTTALPITDVCENLDDDICLRISFADPSFCSNDCIASHICPRMCRKCFQCYDCNDIDQPTDCNHKRTCTAGKECFQLQTLSFDLRPVYRLGCIDANLCQRFGAPVQTGFGRRQTGVSLTGGCCKTDLCNRGTLQQMHEATTTQSPVVHTTHKTQSHVVLTTHRPVGINCNLNHQNINHHCPPEYTYDQHTHSCYHVGTHKLTWQQSVEYCNGICGQLATFGSLHAMQNALSHIDHQVLEMGLWTDAVSDIQGNFIWIHNNTQLSSDLSHSITHSKSTCAVVVDTSAHGIRLHTHTCTDLMHPLCETARS